MRIKDVPVKREEPFTKLDHARRIEPIAKAVYRVWTTKDPDPLPAKKVINEIGKSLQFQGKLAAVPCL